MNFNKCVKACNCHHNQFFSFLKIQLTEQNIK